MSKDIGQDIRKRAEPFLKWLETADEESDSEEEEEEDDTVEVCTTCLSYTKHIWRTTHTSHIPQIHQW